MEQPPAALCFYVLRKALHTLFRDSGIPWLDKAPFFFHQMGDWEFAPTHVPQQPTSAALM